MGGKGSGRKPVHGHFRNGKPSAVYRRWVGIITRCYDQNAENYERYGGRGVTVCDRWRESFVNFLSDMGNIPFPGAQIERKDNNGPYSPDNCVWSTRKRQARNRRTTRMLTHNNKTQCMADWADELGIPMRTIARRINGDGWSIEKALSTPIDTRKRNIGRRSGVSGESETPAENA